MDVMVSDRLQYALSTSIGCFFGATISLIVDSALFEIGVSRAFSCIFGGCLCTIGGILLMRIRPHRGERLSRWMTLIFAFSCLVFLSGIFCLLLKEGWLLSLSPNWKLPMYTAIGTSLSFALTFSIVDMINNWNCSSHEIIQPLVQSSKQVYVVLMSSLVMGFLFGFSFGLIDVEDSSRLNNRLDEDQAINTAIGAFIGALMGGANQYLRDKQLVATSPYVAFSVDDYS